MNSVIGKCATVSQGWIDDARGAPPEPWTTWAGTDYDTGKACLWRSIGNHPQRKVELGESPEGCPFIASYVYSLARVRLWEWMEIAGRENIFYVDTDGMYTSSRGFELLSQRGCIQDGAMGGLRLLGVYPWLVVHGIKAYETDARRVICGLPKQGATLQAGAYEFWCAETIGNTVREKPHGRAPAARLQRYTAQQSRPYRHGVVLPSGAVRPIEI